MKTENTTKLTFPLKVLDQHAAVLGKTGAGKSSAMRHVVEYLLSHGKRVCVVDPKGDWWGLKASADGKSAGYPVITFGSFKGDYEADVPVNEHSGKHVAELITSGNRPCVIGFRGWFTAHMIQFWIDFAKTLFHTNEGELYLIIDEAQNFAPKGRLADIEGKAGTGLHWTNRLLAEGRGLGINIWVGSQRPQKVHNDTLDGCETLVAMRTVHPAALGSIDFGQVKDSLGVIRKHIVNPTLPKVSEMRGIFNRVEIAPLTGKGAKGTDRARPFAAESRVGIATNGEVPSGGLKRMMIALAQRPGLSKKQLGLRATLSSKSGTFGTYLSTLRKNGWLDGDGNQMRLTDDGMSALGSYDPLPEGEALFHHWMRELGDGGAARMLQSLFDAYPNGLTKTELGESANISSASGTFGTYLSTLRRLELINGKSEIKASDEFFQ